MRLSTGVAKLENGLATAASKLAVLTEDLRCAAGDAVSSFKLQVQAQILADTRRKLKTLPPLDRQEVELRAAEINMIRDAAAVRRQEMKLRRAIGRKVARGELPYEQFVPMVEARDE